MIQVAFLDHSNMCFEAMISLPSKPCVWSGWAPLQAHFSISDFESLSVAACIFGMVPAQNSVRVR